MGWVEIVAAVASILSFIAGLFKGRADAKAQIAQRITDIGLGTNDDNALQHLKQLLHM